MTGETTGAYEAKGGAKAAPDADRPGRWKRRKDARPAEILTAALSVFSEKGFAAAKLDDVAKRAGVSKGTLYLYFDSKEALFKAVVRDAVLPNLTMAEALAKSAEAPSAEILAALLKNLARAVAETKLGAIPKLIIAEAGSFPDLARFYHDEVIARAVTLISRIVTRGVVRGEFRPVDARLAVYQTIAPVLVAAVWQGTFERAGAPRLDPQALIDQHLDVLLRGLTAPRNPERDR
jgi:AcrR family transcriptional regulator